MSIRIAHLKVPFVYKSMAEIEATRSRDAAVELPHRHDFFTIIAIEKAEGTHQIDFKHYDVKDNTVFFISPEQVHRLSITEGVPSGHVVMFTPDFLLQYSISPERLTELELFFNCDESKPLYLNSDEMRFLSVFFNKIKDETADEKAYRNEALGAWLKLLLLEMRRYKSGKQLKSDKRGSRQADIVRRFKNDVETQFRAWHQVQNYAEAQNLTSNYLNEVIKSETGTSAKDFIQNRLILEAKRLARYSDMTAKEIAYALGYEDVAHFSKFFKKCEGRSFSAFR